MNYKKMMNEEPNEDNIKKEVELKSQIRTLELNSQLAVSSLNEEKSLNEALNKKIGELEKDYNKKIFKGTETIKSLEKKIEELENKLYNPINNGYSNESLQYYLSLFNDNINQFISLVNKQIKINNDLSENHTNKLENIINEKEKGFNHIVNDIILKITEFNNNNKELIEKNNNEKINWLKIQIDELMPFKQKCLILNEQILKLQNENEILKNKCENTTKLSKEKEELNKLKFQKIKDKVKETFDNFIVQNCPNKYDDFKLICKNFSIEALV